ncbi:translation-associated GTPase, partial [Candidatus Haloredivivus sp. G17]
ELDRKIEKGPHATRKFYQDYSDNLSDTLDEDELNEISKEISDRDNEYLNESDHKIIDFFSNEANQPGIKEVINISGVLTNVLGLVDEMDIKSYCLTPNIESTAYFWVYLNIYELILDTLSKNILQYYRQQDDLSKARKNSMKELEKKVEKGEHFSSGKIESELVYWPGNNDFEILQEDEMNDQQKKALEDVREFIEEFGGTGVQEVMEKALFDVLDVIAVFPGGADGLGDKHGNIYLFDCFLIPGGSTAEDFAYEIHSDIGDGFIHAIDCRDNRQIGGDHELEHRDVIE